jgi:hypothetical protein
MYVYVCAMIGMQGNVLKLFKSIKLSQMKKMYRYETSKMKQK